MIRLNSSRFSFFLPRVSLVVLSLWIGATLPGSARSEVQEGSPKDLGPRIRMHHRELQWRPSGERTQRWFRRIQADSKGNFGTCLKFRRGLDEPEVRILHAGLSLAGSPERTLPVELQKVETPRWWGFEAPSAEPGAILEIYCESTDSVGPLKKAFSPVHHFGSGSPADLEIFEVRIPEGTPAKTLTRGLSQGAEPEVEERDGWRVYRWKVESPGGSRMDPAHRPYARLSLLDTWDQIADWYRSLHRERSHPTQALTHAAQAIAGLSFTVEEKWQALLSFVGNLTYEDRPQGQIQALVGRAAPEVLKRGRGNCADRANLLLALGRSLGLEGDLVLTSTAKSRPLDPEIPSFFPADHALAMLRTPKGSFVVDPTVGGERPGTLGRESRGRLAFVPRTRRFFHLPPGN